MGLHDHGYKQLFSYPEMVRDLLLGFVPFNWVHEIDFSTLEKLNNKEWLSQVLSKNDFPGIEVASIRDLTEMQTMLSERIKDWGRPYLERGIEQGIELGEARLLKQLLKTKFGELPAEVIGQIDRAGRTELEAWSSQIFDAPHSERYLLSDDSTS